MFTVWRPRRREDEIEEMVAARLARHRIYERKPAPTLNFVIEESVAERPFGGVDVLRGQLEHIILRAQALSPAESVRHIEKLLQGEL